MLRKGGLSLGAYQELGTMLALHGVVFHLFSTTTAEHITVETTRVQARQRGLRFRGFLKVMRLVSGRAGT